ncbi:copper resistance protein B [Sphingomonas xanthus]|uniref:Copper resistance protein B n=2 Tax=Sphingomonas xanthus TaxID=2594473 RepID=A0A516IUM3_9SPHN|nr:copper resistance protein B [Sphingomonas xanthus]
MGHCKLPEPAAEPVPAAPAATTSCQPEHAAMGHCEPAAVDPHAGHDMGAAQQVEIPVRPAPAEALAGPADAADAVWGSDAMARGRSILRKEHGDMTVAKLLIDRAEQQFRKGRDGYVVDAQGWIGGDIDKLWLKTEVEGDWGRKVEEAEVQALWSHAIGPWFDLQAGLRGDFGEGPNRTHLALGVQGLLPYWVEVDGALFLSSKGEVTARAEAEYDLRITQKLIVQPRVEAGLSAQKVGELGLGSGLTDAALGVRLRYEISPLFAPYAGVDYERAFGATRDYRRAHGERGGGLNLVVGIRTWF